jgi:hypothetical protein
MGENAQISCPIQCREAFYLYRKWLESSTNALGEDPKGETKVTIPITAAMAPNVYFNIVANHTLRQLK